MSLARTNSPLSKLIIRNIGDVGGPRSDHVDAELDSLIAWAKDAVRCIHADTTATGNVGVGLDTLHTFTLDTPNRLTTNGDWVRVGYGGLFAANNNTKRIRTAFDNQVVFDSGARDIDAALAWRIMTDYIRVSATSIRGTGLALLGNVLSGTDGALDTTNSRWYYAAINTTLTVANLTSNAVNMFVQGEATANDDIVQNASIIELRQQ